APSSSCLPRNLAGGWLRSTTTTRKRPRSGQKLFGEPRRAMSRPRRSGRLTRGSRGPSCASRAVEVDAAVVLWDFGDTLVDERWMRRNPSSCTTWEQAWIDVMAELADAWNVGDVSAHNVFA